MIFHSLYLTKNLNFFSILSHCSQPIRRLKIFDFCEPINRQHHVRHAQCSIISTIISWKAFKWMRCIAGQSLTRAVNRINWEESSLKTSKKKVAQKVADSRIIELRLFLHIFPAHSYPQAEHKISNSILKLQKNQQNEFIIAFFFRLVTQTKYQTVISCFSNYFKSLEYDSISEKSQMDVICIYHPAPPLTYIWFSRISRSMTNCRLHRIEKLEQKNWSVIIEGS